MQICSPICLIRLLDNLSSALEKWFNLAECIECWLLLAELIHIWEPLLRCFIIIQYCLWPSAFWEAWNYWRSHYSWILSNITCDVLNLINYIMHQNVFEFLFTIQLQSLWLIQSYNTLYIFILPLCITQRKSTLIMWLTTAELHEIRWQKVLENS